MTVRVYYSNKTWHRIEPPDTVIGEQYEIDEDLWLEFARAKLAYENASMRIVDATRDRWLQEYGTMTLEEAAGMLKDTLNAYSQPHEPNVTVGIAEATGTIFVYAHVSESHWNGVLPEDVGGYRIVYDFNVGRTVAA
jgi:hypothetical protein